MRLTVKQVVRAIGGHDHFAHANGYQEGATRTAVYSGKHEDAGLAYLSSGLASEAGEVCGIIKRAQAQGRPTNEHELVQLIEECGDVLWYVAEIMNHFSVPLSTVMHANLNKLRDRHEQRMNMLVQGDVNRGGQGESQGYTASSAERSRHDSLGDRPTGKSPPRTPYGTDTSVRSGDAGKESVSRRTSGRVVRAKVRPLQRATRKNRKSV